MDLFVGREEAHLPSVRRDEVVRRDEEIEPVQRDTGQDLPLARDVLVEDDVEGRNAVSGDNEQVVCVDTEDLPNLA